MEIAISPWADPGGIFFEPTKCRPPSSWMQAFADILKGKRQFSSLSDADFDYDVRQKGTDMKIGLDIASVAYKRQVDQIVLVAGDADFVPAAKLARREGVDFILDPMWTKIADDLHEHIDGLRSTSPRPRTGMDP